MLIPIILLFISMAFASPLSVGSIHQDCKLRVPTYKTYTQKEVSGKTSIAAASCVAESAGCSLSLSEAYSVGVDVSVGLNLGINDETASAGLSASVSYSTARITTDTANANCPAGGWTCGLAITPAMYQITGHVDWSTPLHPCWNDKGKDGDYTIKYPIKDAQGKPRIKVWACACPDEKGWADKGAPPKCPANCNGSTA